MQSMTAFSLTMEWLSHWMFALRWSRVLWWHSKMALVTNEVLIMIIGGVSVVGIVIISSFMWCCCVMV